jgi:hypothetical protein
MRAAAIILFASGLAIAADASCPWIAEPTAAGLLGGPVQTKITGESCDFSRAQADLRVEVRRMADPKKEFARSMKHCGKKAVAITGIGNEAFACSDGSVLARVRDMVFTIRVTAPGDSAEVARKAAEHVAGGLF